MLATESKHSSLWGLVPCKPSAPYPQLLLQFTPSIAFPPSGATSLAPFRANNHLPHFHPWVNMSPEPGPFQSGDFPKVVCQLSLTELVGLTPWQLPVAALGPHYPWLRITSVPAVSPSHSSLIDYFLSTKWQLPPGLYLLWLQALLS